MRFQVSGERHQRSRKECDSFASSGNMRVRACVYMYMRVRARVYVCVCSSLHLGVGTPLLSRMRSNVTLLAQREIFLRRRRPARDALD